MATLSPKETAKIICNNLKTQFGLKVKRTTESTCLTVRWNFGAAPKVIRKYMNDFKAGSYNGLIDLYVYSDSPPPKHGGANMHQYKWVLAERECFNNETETFRNALGKAIALQHKQGETLAEKSPEFWDYFRVWSYNDIGCEVFSDLNFHVQEGVEFSRVEYDPEVKISSNRCDFYKVFYNHKGQEFEATRGETVHPLALKAKPSKGAECANLAKVEPSEPQPCTLDECETAQARY